MTCDFVFGRDVFVTTPGTGLDLVFFDRLVGTNFLDGFGMGVSFAKEPTIGAPTTQSPQFTGCRQFAV